MRDSMEQKRMKISDLDSVLSEYIAYPWLSENRKFYFYIQSYLGTNPRLKMEFIKN
jgi:hypothetical protein